MQKISEVFYATVIYALFCQLSLVLNRWQHNRFASEAYAKIILMDLVLIIVVSLVYIIYLICLIRTVDTE